MNTAKIFIFIILLGVVAHAHASEAPIQEHTIVVANRSEVPLREVSASVSVLDAEDLAQLGYLSIGDALASMPSTSLSNNGGMGKTSAISVRGEAGFRTLVFIDGINIADPSAPQAVAPLEHTLINGISRVEVLRGPHGLSYGADAGGVINLTSTQANEEGLNARVNAEGGSFSTTNFGGDLAFLSDKISFSFIANQLETDGFNASTTDLEADDDGYENTTVHTRLAANLSSNLSVEAVYRSVEGETEYDGCYRNITFDFIHACSSTYDQESQRLALTFTKFGKQQLAYSQTDIDRNNYADDEFSFAALGSTKRLEFRGAADLNAQHSVVYGVDDLTDELADAQRERGQSGAWLEYLGSWNEDVFINLGLRYDDNDDFDSHTSYRFGAAKLVAVNAQDEIKLKASYGTGFRAPSIYEEYLNSFGPATMPALQEESSRGFDIGLEFYGNDGLHLELLYFEQHVEDEIYYDLDSYTGYLQGEGESEASGVELIAEVPLNATWSYHFNYTYTDSKESDGSVRSRVPKNSANLGLFASLLDQRLRLAFNLRANADIQDAAVATRFDNYRVLDANLRFAVLPNLDIYLRLENVLDEEYQSVPGFYAAEAAAYSGISLRF